MFSATAVLDSASLVAESSGTTLSDSISASTYSGTSKIDQYSHSAASPSGSLTAGTFTRSTSSSAAASTSSSSGSSSIKRGAGWSNKPSSKITDETAQVLAKTSSWYYTWNENPVEGMPDSVQFVPALWGANETQAKQLVDNILAQDTLPEYFFGPNECDIEGQCNAAPNVVAAIYTK